MRFALLLLLLSCWSAFAHDPYEIVSTAYLREDRLDVEVLMEFAAAIALVPESGARPFASSEQESFIEMRSRLKEQAETFFQVTAAGDVLPLNTATVQLEVENHVRFDLSFPVPQAPSLQFDARGVTQLQERGPYGTTLTVLDLVNSRVLGQEVLSGPSPVTVLAISAPDVAPAEPDARPQEPIAAQSEAGAAARIVTNDMDLANRSSPDKAPAWWLVVGAVTIGVAFLAFLHRQFRRSTAEPLSST